MNSTFSESASPTIHTVVTPIQFQATSITGLGSIHVADFLSLIAYATLPPREDAAGIDCIVDVVQPVSRPPTWLPFAVEGTVRADLEFVLADLPEIRYPFQAGTAEEFIKRYLLLAYRPAWVPLLLQPYNLVKDKVRRAAIVRSMREQFQQDSRFALANQSHHPLPSSARTGYLSTALAHTLLAERGLDLKCDSLLQRYGCLLDRVHEDYRGDAGKFGYPGFPDELLRTGTIKPLTLERWRRELNRGKQAPGAQSTRAMPQRRTLEVDDVNRGPADDGAEEDLIEITAPMPLRHSTKDKQASSEAAMTKVNSEQSDEYLMSLDDVAKLLGCHKNTVRNRISPEKAASFDPTFPKPRPLKGPMKWRRGDIMTYIKSHPSL